jgi:hypothetical protein
MAVLGYTAMKKLLQGFPKFYFHEKAPLDHLLVIHNHQPTLQSGILEQTLRYRIWQ